MSPNLRAELKDWSKNELIREVERLRTMLSEHSTTPGTDPAGETGSITDVAGDPHARGGAIADARNAVLMDAVGVMLVDEMRDRAPRVMLELGGRVNRRDDRAQHVYLFDHDGAAAIVTELVGLAARAGQPFAQLFHEAIDLRLGKMP